MALQLAPISYFLNTHEMLSSILRTFEALDDLFSNFFFEPVHAYFLDPREQLHIGGSKYFQWIIITSVYII